MLAPIGDIDSDAGPRSGRGARMRFCALRRVAAPLEDLLRFVVDPEGQVVPDVKAKLPGRGVWVTADAASVAEAARRRVFARAFKRDVAVPPGLERLAQTALERHALDALAVAVKAGQAIAGFAKAEAVLRSGRAAGLIHARDASAEGARKLDALARGAGEAAENVPVIRAFTSAQLDLAFGRSNVVHAALLAGSASQGFLGRCHRLARFMNPAHAAAGEVAT